MPLQDLPYPIRTHVNFYEYLQWSPDSNSFALSLGDRVMRVDLATSSQTEVLRENIYDFSWRPDGSYVFGLPEKGLFLAASRSRRKQLTTQKSDEGQHGNAQALPDGNSFLFEKRRTTQVETWLGRFDGRDPTLLLTATSQALYAPPGYLLYLQGDSILAHPFDATHGTLTGDPKTVVNGVGRSDDLPVLAWFSVSANGVLAFRQGSVTNPTRLTWFDRRGKMIGALGDVADYSNPALSPDGHRLAVCIRDSRGTRDIWVIDLTRGFKTRLTVDPSDDSNPAWSPDGSEIAYSSDRHGHRDMYVRSSSGTGQERVLFESNEDKTVLDWSPDGKSLFYSVLNPKTSRDLWILPMTGTVRTPALFLGTPFSEDWAAVAPDNRLVLYRSFESGPPQLYVQPLPPNGQKWQISNSAAVEAQWRADGREVFYISGRDLIAVDISITGGSLQLGASHALFRLPSMESEGKNRFIASRDGQRFLLITTEQARVESLTPFVVIVNWLRLLENK
jgi:Tol biopolymer transport system component